ncbi:phosphatase PAP2 family protein [Limibacter armeniacum]|uniref:phosphatase PAP2 family protein n=1 Tax=Limibacter armeniacum TaxID=466084 RepID=UPI002FE5C1B7
MRNTMVLVVCLFVGCMQLYAQNNSVDTLKKVKPTYWKSLIVPTVLISFGTIGTYNKHLNHINLELREEVNEHIDEGITIDDFTQFVPSLSVYALNMAGIKGKSAFWKRTTVLATATLIMGSSVLTLKNNTQILRPDGSSTNSFPSGHTATAFMGAEFLRQEYKDISCWYGVAGYMVAAGTGLFRIYNNRHWLTDVATGAGIGILSTRIAYWVYPLMEKVASKSGRKTNSALLLPFYQQGSLGVSFSLKL